MNSQKQRKQWAAGAASQPVQLSGGQQKPTARKGGGQGKTGPKAKDLTGLKFGRLSVVRYERTNSGWRWLCQCECGTTKHFVGSNLSLGVSQSCGCLQKQLASKRVTKHGLSGSPEFHIWRSMIQRCCNKNRKDYPKYGGRGIKVDSGWLASFEAFYSSVGPRPTPKHSLDRINNNGNYEPGNVRWATSSEQALNRRSTHMIEYKGQTMSITQWCRHFGWPRLLISTRLRLGWSLDKAMSTPYKGRVG